MQTMLKLFALGAAGVPIAEEITNFDFRKTMQIAVEQGVWQIVFAGLKEAVQEGYVQLSEEDQVLFEEFRKQLLVSCLKQDKRYEAVQNIIRQLNEKGICCCVLKGRALSYLYKHPECRTSSDVDLLVSEEAEAAALDVFRKNGFEVSVRAQSANHDKCYHEEIGSVELHVSLYYDIMQDVWFDNAQMLKEPFMEQNGILTLGVTDGYLFTLLHAIKHFLSNSLYVKQIMDVLLYEKRYKKEIDFPRVQKILTHLKYMEFTNALKGFGVEYFGFSKSDFMDFSYEKEKVEKLLQDVFQGAQSGAKEEREEFFEIYNAARFSTFKKGNFQKFMTDWRRKNVRKAMSFSRKNIEIRYPYVCNKAYLLPIAWINHVYVIIKTGLKRFNLVRQSVKYEAPDMKDKQIQERLELFKDFDMI